MQDILVKKADNFCHEVYRITKEFPPSEIYGVTSQIRRSSLSVVLNIIEGFARNSKREYIHFLNTSYASLKETKYLLFFCVREKYLSQSEYKQAISLAEEIGKMLWTKIQRLKK